MGTADDPVPVRRQDITCGNGDKSYMPYGDTVPQWVKSFVDSCHHAASMVFATSASTDILFYHATKHPQRLTDTHTAIYNQYSVVHIKFITYTRQFYDDHFNIYSLFRFHL